MPPNSSNCPRVADQTEPLKTTMDILVSGDFNARWDVTKQIPDLGEQAIPHLLALLEDQQVPWECHWFVARGLAHFDRPEVVAALVERLLQTDDEELAQVLAAALAQIGAAAVMALAGLLPDPTRRFAAVTALASINHPSSLVSLLSVTDDPDPNLRATVMAALAQYRDPALLSVFQQGLADPASQVRRAAVDGLVSLRTRLNPDQYVALLQPLLQDVNLEISRAAIQALGRTQTRSATIALGKLGSRPATPAGLQRAVIQALGFQETAAAVEQLVAIWENGSPDLRLPLVTALSRLQSPPLKARATEILVGWLLPLQTRAEGVSLRRAIAFGLGQLGAMGAETVLRSLLQDPDQGVRLHAAAALAGLNQPSPGRSDPVPPEA